MDQSCWLSEYEPDQRCRMLLSLIEMVDQPAVAIDEKGRIVYANPATAQMCGYPQDRIAGVTISTLFDFSDEEKQRLSDCRQQGLGCSFDTRTIAVDGDQTPVKIRILPLQAITRTRSTAVVTQNPIGGQPSEMILADGEKVYRDLYENSPLPLWVEDFSELRVYLRDIGRRGVEDWRNYFETIPAEVEKCFGMINVLDVNQASLKLYGADTKAELQGNLSKVLPSNPDEGLLNILVAVATGKTFAAECINKTLDGREITVLLQASIPPGYPKTWPRVLVSIQDMTTRLKVERRQKKLEAQLIQAQKMEALGTLSGGIAHDFNNLLMAIQGNTSLMLMNLDSDHPLYSKLANIEKYVQSGANLTRQLLGFAREGKYEVKAADINRIIEKTANMFGRTKREIFIYRDLAKDIRPVEVDQGQIEQVLLNLFLNAWQSMAEGGEIYVRTSNTAIGGEEIDLYGVAPGNYVKTEVKDAGIGMDIDIQRRVFDPFFTTKEMGRGTGLGLAAAYGIIKNHGGIITCKSQKGKGTTFSVYLPVTTCTTSHPEPTIVDGILSGNETILLVDDEPMIIDVGKQMLEHLGYQVVCAHGGQDAVDIYSNNPSAIDMVILDMVMPELGGGQVYDRLKAVNPRIKALLSSGYSIDGQASTILARGCNGFIQKPFNLGDLAHRIREVLDQD